MMTESLTDCPLHNEFLRRLKGGRDLRVIVSAENASTGVGKTTCGYCLALQWDVTGNWTIDKATIDPAEYSVMYGNVPPGSVVLLDEAEKGLEARRSMAQEVLEVGHDFATLRYRQVFGVMTLPSKGMIDKRIADQLCDYWLVCQERPKGSANIYKFGYNEVLQKPFKEFVGTYKFPPMDSDPEFQKLEQMKEDKMENEIKSKYVHRKELEEMKENWWNKASSQRAFNLIRTVHDHMDTSQSEIARALNISQPTVSNVVNAGDFEEWYSPGSRALAGN